eukprot:6090590-Prymnesium_polylepis.1
MARFKTTWPGSNQNGPSGALPPTRRTTLFSPRVALHGVTCGVTCSSATAPPLPMECHCHCHAPPSQVPLLLLAHTRAQHTLAPSRIVRSNSREIDVPSPPDSSADTCDTKRQHAPR